MKVSELMVRYPVMLNRNTPPLSNTSYLELLGFKKFMMVDSLKL